MNEVREFASMVCVSAIGCCALKLLLPENGLEPVLRTILSAFFLLCLLMPLRGLSISFPDAQAIESAAEPGTAGLMETYREQLERSVENNLREVIGVRLEKLGVASGEASLEIHAHTGGDGRIDIESIEVLLDEGHAALSPQIESLITQELELPCRIHVAGED